MGDDTAEHMAYVAVHDCGRVVAACMDMPEHKRETAKEIADWVRRGLDVERRTSEEVRAAEWCDCFTKARALLKKHGAKA